MAQPDYDLLPRPGLMWATAADYDGDGDDDSNPASDTDHDWWSTDGRPMRAQGASGLPQIQQHTDPNNKPDPGGDELPVGVAFPVGDNDPQSAFGQQWSTGPDGPQPRTGAILVEAASWSRKHYEDLARAISTLPEHVRRPVAESFGRQMPGTGSNGLGPFDRDKFVGAATDPSGYSWRSQHRHPDYTRGHHDQVAEMLRGAQHSVSPEDFANHVVPTISDTMERGSGWTGNGNRTFSAERFRQVMNGDRSPAAPRQSYPRGPRRTQEYPFSRGDAEPLPRSRSHSPAPQAPAGSSYARGFSDEGTHYDPYGEGFTNPSRGGRPPETETEYDPIFGWRNKAMLRRTAYAQVSSTGADMLGRADAMNNQQPEHKDSFGASRQKHRRYLEGWNQTAGLIHGLVGRAPMSKEEYGAKTGRPDMHSHYLSAYAQGRAMHGQSNSLYRADDGGQATASLRAQADAWSQPHQSTDDFSPPYNSAETSPDPWSQQEGGDYQAGVSAGRSDRQAGERPLFADNSSGVSPYVKGYAEGYGSGRPPAGPQDVPLSMGGDSGQAYNAQEAHRSFQVARASRTASAQDAWADARGNLERQHDVRGGHEISGAPGDESLEGEGTGGRSGATWKVSSLRRTSAAFAPDSLMADADFRKGYLFARRWQRGQRLAGRGSARFEAGLYAGITDNPRMQDSWTAAHAAQGPRHRELVRRMGLHQSFTGKLLGSYGHPPMRYLAGTSTDLITDGPGTSPDPMGSTPLNGPGSPPPMAGRDEAAQAGGAPPYQGAPPLPGGPVVPDDVMGAPQRAPEPSGAFTNTFSGQHPENAVLAPVAPNKADSSGYTNPGAYPQGNNRLAAFRQRVQAALAAMEEF